MVNKIGNCAKLNENSTWVNQALLSLEKRILDLKNGESTSQQSTCEGEKLEDKA